MYTNPGYHHSNPDSTDLNAESRLQIVDEFLKILDAGSVEVLKRLNRREAGWRSFDLSEVYQELLCVGVKQILEGNPPKFDRLFGLVYFLLYYFCRAFERADLPKERDRLVQRFMAAPLEKLGFCPLFFELAVGESFKARGHKVEYLPEKTGEKSPDMKVSTVCGDYFVECKCRSMSTVPKFLSRHNEMIALLDPFTVGVDIKTSLFRIDYFGKRSDEGASALKTLESLLNGRGAKDLPLRDSMWELSIVELPVDLAEKISDDPLSNMWNIGEELQPAFVSQRSGFPITAIYAEEISRLHETLDEALKGALGQLPSHTLRLTFIQLIGAGGKVAVDKNFLTDLLLQSTNLTRRVNNEAKRDDGFVAFGLFADFELGDLGSGLFRLNYMGTQMISQKPDGNLFYFDLMRVLPSTVAQFLS